MSIVVNDLGTSVAAYCNEEENGVVDIYMGEWRTKIEHPVFSTQYTLRCGSICDYSSIIFCKDPVTGVITTDVRDNGPIGECKSNRLVLPSYGIIIQDCQPNCFKLISTDPK
jgi:hypothetical protein